MSKDAEDSYYKYTGRSSGFTDAGRPLAPGQIVRLDGEDGPDAEGNRRMIREGSFVRVPAETLEAQNDAIFDAIDRQTKRGTKLRERRDETVQAADEEAR